MATYSRYLIPSRDSGFRLIGASISSDSVNFVCIGLPFSSGSFQWVIKNNPSDPDNQAVAANFGTLTENKLSVTFDLVASAFTIGNTYYFALRLTNNNVTREVIQVSFKVGQNAVGGSNTLNFPASAILNATLTGLNTNQTNPVTQVDSLLTSIGKLQGQINAAQTLLTTKADKTTDLIILQESNGSYSWNGTNYGTNAGTAVLAAFNSLGATNTIRAQQGPGFIFQGDVFDFPTGLSLDITGNAALRLDERCQLHFIRGKTDTKFTMPTLRTINIKGWFHFLNDVNCDTQATHIDVNDYVFFIDSCYNVTVRWLDNSRAGSYMYFFNSATSGALGELNVYDCPGIFGFGRNDTLGGGIQSLGRNFWRVNFYNVYVEQTRVSVGDRLSNKRFNPAGSDVGVPGTTYDKVLEVITSIPADGRVYTAGMNLVRAKEFKWKNCTVRGDVFFGSEQSPHTDSIIEGFYVYPAINNLYAAFTASKNDTQNGLDCFNLKFINNNLFRVKMELDGNASGRFKQCVIADNFIQGYNPADPNCRGIYINRQDDCVIRDNRFIDCFDCISTNGGTNTVFENNRSLSGCINGITDFSNESTHRYINNDFSNCTTANISTTGNCFIQGNRGVQNRNPNRVVYKHPIDAANAAPRVSTEYQDAEGVIRAYNNVISYSRNEFGARGYGDLTARASNGSGSAVVLTSANAPTTYKGALNLS